MFAGFILADPLRKIKTVAIHPATLEVGEF